MRPAQSILALAIAVAVLRGSLACNRAPADNGFSLPTPTGFVKREPTQPHVVLVLHHEATAAKVTDMLIVTAVPLQHPDRPPTIEAEIDSDKRVLTKNHPEAAYGPVETIVVDGADGRLFWVTYQLKEKAVRSHRMLVFHDSKVYMALFTTDQSRGEEADEQFKSILATWKWSKN